MIQQSGIYEILNTVNGKRYIGSAVNLAKRWKEHRTGLNRKDHANQILQRVRLANLGRKATPETRVKMAAAQKARRALEGQQC